MKSIFTLASLLGTAAMLASCGSLPEAPGMVGAGGVSTPTSVGSDTFDAEDWPYEAGELLSGTAHPDFPAGDAGQVAVVHVGPLDGSSLLFAYRNNTDAAISHVDWSATARSGGKIVATGSSHGGTPAQVPPGGVGLAYIYFGSDTTIPGDAEYEFSEEHLPADATPFNTAPLVITETNVVGGSIVGQAINRTENPVTGPFGVDVYCFDGDELLLEAGAFTEQSGEIENGETVSFTADLNGEECPSYIVGVSGFFS